MNFTFDITQTARWLVRSIIIGLGLCIHHTIRFPIRQTNRSCVAGFVSRRGSIFRLACNALLHSWGIYAVAKKLDLHFPEIKQMSTDSVEYRFSDLSHWRFFAGALNDGWYSTDEPLLRRGIRQPKGNICCFTPEF